MSNVVALADWPLHELLHDTIRRLYSPSARIVAVTSYRPGYLRFPARLTIETAPGAYATCVLKASSSADRITHEARVSQALTELGFPVPTVLAEPLVINHDDQSSVILLLSELPGQPLPWLGLTDLATASQTCCLLQQAIDGVHAATPLVRTHPVRDILPSVTLEDELRTIVARGGPWFDVALIGEAIELMTKALPSLVTPLVFSNGDYNPLNFLHVGPEVTGWLDFEAARFEDPYIGFAKFLLWADDAYGWGAGAKAGLVERYLYAHNLAASAFLPRLLLRGLTYLQDHSTEKPPRHLLHVIEDAVNRLKLIYPR